MRSYPYLLVDVFTEVALQGNPLAVFPAAQGLGDERLQAIARELNLSETVFVFEREPGCARVRIFTPRQELDFAGHPTLGTVFALLRHDRAPNAASTFVLREPIGEVSVAVERLDPFFAWLATPPIRLGALYDGSACALALNLHPHDAHPHAPPRLAGAGFLPFLYVPLAGREAVDRARLDEGRLRALLDPDGINGVFLFAPTPGGAYARMFAPMSGIAEDPATGSAVGPLGAYLAEHGLLAAGDHAEFTVEQGTAMHRRSLLHGRLRQREGAPAFVEVGGSAAYVGEGALQLAP